MPLHRWIPAALTIVLAACGGSTDEEDPLACPQTYEFGNVGCARAAGRVLGSAGKPLAGVDVITRLEVDPSRGYYYGGYGTSDGQGHFGVQLTRDHEPAVIPTPDTLTVYLVAAHFRADTVVRDSAAVTFTFAPVGEIPPTVSIDLQLPSH